MGKIFEDREYYYSIKYKSQLKCDYFESLYLHEYQADNILSRLYVPAKEATNNIISNIAGVSYLVLISAKDRNQATFIPVKDKVGIKFCKNTIGVILGIGRKKI